MAHFPLDTKARAWCVTVQIENMKKMGLTEDEYMNHDFLCDFLINLWQDSGSDRKSACAVCITDDGLYHAHMALYGNSTTLRYVAKTLSNSHTEPQLGGKKDLKKYLLKEPPYDEKKEQVLIVKGLDNIEDVKDHHPTLDKAQELINQGYKPEQIFDINLYYRKYEKIIKNAYINKRINDTPLKKDMYIEWHCGDAGTGKSYEYIKLCEKHGELNVYFCTDLDNGGFDLYLDRGAPPILFIDEFKGQLSYHKLLQLTDRYSRAQTHCRYGNTYNLWTTIIITSIYPPDEIYKELVESSKRERDNLAQLMRRITKIVYHYKENNDYKTYTMSSETYRNYEDLKQKALGNNDGFMPTANEKIPF